MPCPLHVHATCTPPPAGTSSDAGTPAAAESWRECPRCSMRWTTGKVRVRQRTVETVTAEEASESEEEEPGISEEFAVSNQVGK
jgi:hypothetical protein